MFESLPRLLLGLFTGMIFGFLLQKGQVAKFHVIVGQLLLRNFIVLKIMAAAIATGAIGVNFLIAMGWADAHIVSASLGRILTGAVLFGIGMAVLGYCPGTSVAACGEGRRDAMVGVLGMFCGALTYVLAFPLLLPLMESLENLGKTTLPEVTHSPLWLWVGGVVILLAAALIWLEHIHPKALDATNP
jgi:hypothetical protein